MPEQLWTVGQAAEFLNVSRRWIYYALQREPEEAGSIPHLYVGKQLRFVPDVVRAWVSDGCPPAITMQTGREKRGKNGKSIQTEV